MLLAAESTNPIIPNVGEIIIGLIAFGVLFALLAKYAFPIFEKTYAERRDSIEGGMARAAQAQAEAERALETYRAQLAEARDEAAQIRTEARAEGQRIIEEMRRNAEAEANRITERAHQQLAAERASVVSSLRTEIGTLSVDLAGRIVGHSLDNDERQRQLVDDFVSALEVEADAAEAAGAAPAGAGA